MALTEDRKGGGIWFTPSIPWLQMASVYFETSNNKIYHLESYEHNADFGIIIKEVDSIKPWEPDDCTILRNANLPICKISSVEFSIDELAGIIEGFLFVIDHNKITMRSGEIYEQNDSTLKLLWHDESIMMQVNDKHPNT
ncbi:MAG: hypothetical protein HRU38_06725 [Saccharospirillaceae bacterium]|nr:hypothetical protein [Pseudomonadales bacterium]NRB78348.1 hypothetical protein [Saccharospirillaceae bacterium]